jgi:hypothetical protein
VTQLAYSVEVNIITISTTIILTTTLVIIVSITITIMIITTITIIMTGRHQEPGCCGRW